MTGTVLSACLAHGVYVKVINGRCVELESFLPLGADAANWTRTLDAEARVLCDAHEWCAGYMRYIGVPGDEEKHCTAWCGRPQFCHKPSLSADVRWVSYLKANGLRGAPFTSAVADPTGPEDIECTWPYRGSVALWSQDPPPHVVASLAGEVDGGREGQCHVLHHQRGRPVPQVVTNAGGCGGGGAPAFLHGVLSDDEAVVPYFAADVTAEPWIYSVDRNEYIGATAEGGASTSGAADAPVFGPKRHYLSIFFLSPSAACDGQAPRQWGPTEAEEAMPGHVFVDDGEAETRRRAFNPYHFTVICGGPAENETEFVPQAVVDALSFAAHPLVARHVHRRLHRVFFHLPDAAQPYTRIHPWALEHYVENLYMDPEKNDAMYFKQTFLFLLQDLFQYRYRQSPRRRLEASACGLCDERRRQKRLAEATVTAASGAGPMVAAEAVAVAVCVMSRRSGHELRSAIRNTWATCLGSGGSLSGNTELRFFVGAAAEGVEETASVLPDISWNDVVELRSPEAYRAVTLKAFSMLHWTHRAFPNLRFLIRADDDVYLRPGPLLAQLERRPPIAYLWGNFDHGSNPVRDPKHPHYNSQVQFPERRHPLFGDIFPPYARGHLWVMSADLLAMVVDVWRGELMRHKNVSLELASRLPHPDDPALGIALANLVDQDQVSLNLDDRDLNAFALNPSCNATYLNIHNRTWVVHHVDARTMRCMWAIDSSGGGRDIGGGHGCGGALFDLCPCSMEVVEEVDESFGEEEPFDYPRSRFNE